MVLLMIMVILAVVLDGVIIVGLVIQCSGHGSGVGWCY